MVTGRSQVCTAFTPNARWRGAIGDSNIDGTKTDMLCDLQGALVALTFVGMILCASAGYENMR